MKVISKKPKGQRIFKSIGRPYWIEIIDFGWWFSLVDGEWYEGYNNLPKGGSTSSYYAMKREGFNDIYSLKAAKRKIHKWNVPKGTKFSVGLPWVGHGFIITKP